MSQVTTKSLGVDQLPFDDRLALAEELWAGIVAEGSPSLLSQGQRDELDRRLDALELHPGDESEWDEVREAVRSRLLAE